MVTEASFQGVSQYELALLRLLAKMPAGGGQAQEILRRFEAEYRDRIPVSDYQDASSGEPRWSNHVRWSRQYLKERGFLQSPRQGVWYVTDAGRRWLTDHPDADQMPPRVHRQRPGSATVQTGRRRRRRAAPSESHGITLEMLEQTRRAMPDDQFRRVWGTLYEQLLAAEQSKTISNVSQTELGRRARLKLDEVHTFLSGKGNTPGSELLCDWIHFCFTLDLHREAATLIRYISESEVDAAIYRRAKRLADASRARLGWY
mgnify:CR=1 FL=1